MELMTCVPRTVEEIEAFMADSTKPFSPVVWRNEINFHWSFLYDCWGISAVISKAQLISWLSYLNHETDTQSRSAASHKAFIKFKVLMYISHCQFYLTNFTIIQYYIKIFVPPRKIRFLILKKIFLYVPLRKHWIEIDVNKSFNFQLCKRFVHLLVS